MKTGWGAGARMQQRLLRRTFSSWWLVHQPIWKNMLVKLDHLPQVGVKIKKHLKPPPSSFCLFFVPHRPMPQKRKNPTAGGSEIGILIIEQTQKVKSGGNTWTAMRPACGTWYPKQPFFTWMEMVVISHPLLDRHDLGTNRHPTAKNHLEAVFLSKKRSYVNWIWLDSKNLVQKFHKKNMGASAYRFFS